MKNSEILLKGKIMYYEEGNSKWYYKYQDGKLKIKKGKQWVKSRNSLEEINKFILKEMVL